ncbi:MAG: hypothetical protein AAFR11_10920 [Pseudomonadota bacterium]
MLGNLALLKNASELSHYAVARHRVVGENIANADTPGFRARDLEPFSVEKPSEPAMRATRVGHIASASADAGRYSIVTADGGDVLSPNGNSVSLEEQMLLAGDARRQHSLATSIYKKAMDILRTSIAAPR